LPHCVAIKVNLGSLGNEGNDSRRANFRGLADNLVHRSAFWQCLGQRDRAGQGLGLAEFFDAQKGAGFCRIGAFTNPFMATAVEGDDRIAASATIHDDEVVAFFRAEANFPDGWISRLTMDTEVGHGGRK
jgi:hypothetical protein